MKPNDANEGRDVCFLSLSVRGESFGRAAVYDALGVDTCRAPRWVSRGLSEHLRKELRGCSLVCSNRGSRPQYAIVRGVSDLAGLRAGYVDPIGWIRYDKSRKKYIPCAIRGNRPEILRALDAYNAEDRKRTISRLEAGTLISYALHERFPMITPRVGGGIYVAVLTKKDRLWIQAVNRALVFDGGSIVVNVIRGSGETSARAALNLTLDALSLLFDSIMKTKEVAARRNARERIRFNYRRRYNQKRAKIARAVFDAVKISVFPFDVNLSLLIQSAEQTLQRIEESLL